MKVIKAVLYCSSFSYILVRSGFFGTNVITLKDDMDVRHDRIFNDNFILSNRYHFDVKNNRLKKRHRGVSIRPLIIEHFDIDNVKTEYP